MRLVLCDDNRIFCEALAVALEARGHQALAIATTADEDVAAVARHQPDACLLDFRFHEGGDGVGAAQAIRDRSPGTAVLVVSDSGRRVASLAATQAGAAGVAGFVGKDSELDRTATALDAIAARRAPPRPRPLAAAALTPREAEVLKRISAGQGTKTMAREMSVRTETLRTYVKNVLAKLGAHSRLEAAALASRPDLKYQAEETAASTLNAKNQAQASASHCKNCAASGIAFQVIFVSKQGPLTLNADNQASATSSLCVNCSTLAAAYQIIYAANQPGLSRYQIQGLNHVHSELITLQFTGLTGAKLQARTDAIAQEAVGILNNGPNPIPVITSAINNSGDPAQLTENSGPFIDLLVKSQHQG